MRIKFWQGDNSITLPMTPPRFEITKEGSNMRQDVIELGEINILRKPRLAEITLEGIFPASGNKHLLTEGAEYKEPSEYIVFLEAVYASCKPMRIEILDGDEAYNTINEKHVSIESFSYYREGGDEDVGYALRLCKYQDFTGRYEANPEIHTTFAQMLLAKNKTAAKTVPVPKTYTIKPGDTLWAIAKRYLGDGSQYMTIAKLNNMPNPTKIKVGQVIKLPG